MVLLYSSFLLNVFGCVCFVHILKSNRLFIKKKFNRFKLDLKAFRCIFLRYASSQKRYKCYHSSTQRRFVSMDVTFFEIVPFLLRKLFFRGGVFSSFHVPSSPFELLYSFDFDDGIESSEGGCSGLEGVVEGEANERKGRIW